jgi:hypothetical protein
VEGGLPGRTISTYGMSINVAVHPEVLKFTGCIFREGVTLKYPSRAIMCKIAKGYW